MPQLPLSLTLPPVYSEDNFFVSDCNREAHHWVTMWPRWPDNAVLIYGPKGSGKTHLGHIWAKKTNAMMWPAMGVDVVQYPLYTHALVENVERTLNERLLLHLLNHAREQEWNLLITANVMPYRLPFTLPDLTSRLLALPAVAIEHPDDIVLAAVMRKQFADRQMKVDDDVISYALPRMERSLEKVRELVERVDQSALAERKNVTVPFIRKILDNEN